MYRPFTEEQLKKILLVTLALGALIITAVSTARTMEIADSEMRNVGPVGRHYATDYPRERRYDHARRFSDYPYFRSFASGVADPWWPGSHFCYFGSYVACVYSGAFCWQRCY